MKYPMTPERLVLSDVGERFAKACVSKRSDFKWLAIDLCVSRPPIPKGQELPKIEDSNSVKAIVGKLLPNLADAMQESFGVICLNSRNEVIGFSVPFSGGAVFTTVEITTMLKAPLLVPTCTGIIVFHNHPAGDPKPSETDVVLTQRMVSATELVGLRFVDHVVVGAKGTFSFVDAGLLREGKLR